jgi:hypothetical protein
VPGAKLFFPEEMPELIAEEAIGLWHPSRRQAKLVTQIGSAD